MTVFIQKHGDGYVFDGCYSAYEGAQHRGLRIVPFEDIMQVPARRDRLIVVACVEDTVKYLDRLGIKEPESINIPQFLVDAGYIRRKLRYMTLEEFKEYEVDKPMFVKPLLKTKAFPSGVNNRRSTLPLILSDYSGSWDIPVLVSEVVDMVSEYRVYVSKKKGIIGMKHYQGDEFLYPDNSYIRSIVNILIKDEKMPASFSVDFAVIDTGFGQPEFREYTEVIECQDAWSIGAYGLDGEVYLNFLMERWQELMKS